MRTDGWMVGWLVGGWGGLKVSMTKGVRAS